MYVISDSLVVPMSPVRQSICFRAKIVRKLSFNVSWRRCRSNTNE